MKKDKSEDKFETLTENEIIEVVGGETNIRQNVFVAAIELYNKLFD